MTGFPEAWYCMHGQVTARGASLHEACGTADLARFGREAPFVTGAPHIALGVMAAHCARGWADLRVVSSGRRSVLSVRLPE